MIASKPQIDGSASARQWELKFLDEKVKITVNRLVDEPKSLWGEWTIKGNFPGLPHPWAQVHHEGMNLLSTAKKRMAKVLTDLYPSIAWTTIIDKTAELVIQKHREGEPVIQLKDLPPKESLSYRVAPMLRENKPTILYGLGGKGKSLIAQYLACLVSEGYPIGNLLPEPGPVLYLDYEDDGEDLADQMDGIHRGLGIEEGSSVHYRRMGLPLASTIESIHAWVMQLGIQLVIVDSAAPAVGSAQGEEPVLKYFAALRNLNVTTLTIAHRAKNADNGPFGSVFWENMARNVYQMQSEKDSSDRLHLGLFNSKTNRKKQAPFGFCVDFADDKITFTEEDPKSRPEMRKHLSLADQIDAVLKETNGQPWAVKDLAEDLDINPESVRTTLRRNGKFVKLPAGTWGLSVQDNHTRHPL